MYFQSSWLLCSRKVHGKWGYLCNIFVVVAIVWRAVSEKNFFNSCSCRHLRRLLDLLLQWNSIIWVWNPEVVVIHVKYNITVEKMIWEIPNSRTIKKIKKNSPFEYEALALRRNESFLDSLSRIDELGFHQIIFLVSVLYFCLGKIVLSSILDGTIGHVFYGLWQRCNYNSAVLQWQQRGWDGWGLLLQFHILKMKIKKKILIWVSFTKKVRCKTCDEVEKKTLNMPWN